MYTHKTFLENGNVTLKKKHNEMAQSNKNTYTNKCRLLIHESKQDFNTFL